MSAALNIRRPALRYHGGKWMIAPWVSEHFPPHTCYVEPFGGAASVLLRKDPSPIEVYNDLDGRVCNFFRVLRETPDELIRVVELTPYSRAECKLAEQHTEDPLEAARRFYIRSWQGFGSPTRTYAIGWSFQKHFRDREKTRLPQWNDTSHLWTVAARLKTVFIECDQAVKVIKRFDDFGSLHYCDPPYLRSLRNRSHNDYKHEMSIDQHRELAQALAGVKGMAILSGYDSPLYRELYPNWAIVRRNSHDMAGHVRTECLWLSPSAAERVRQLSMDLEHMNG